MGVKLRVQLFLLDVVKHNDFTRTEGSLAMRLAHFERYTMFSSELRKLKRHVNLILCMRTFMARTMLPLGALSHK